MKKDITTTDTQDKQPPASLGVAAHGQNSYQSFKREQVEGTPFTLETDEDKGWRLGLGYHGITEWNTDKRKKEDLLTRIDGFDWNFMTTVIAIICDRVIEQKTFDTLTQMAKEENEKNKPNEGENNNTTK
jgi:hypothetical protein